MGIKNARQTHQISPVVAVAGRCALPPPAKRVLDLRYVSTCPALPPTVLLHLDVLSCEIAKYCISCFKSKLSVNCECNQYVSEKRRKPEKGNRNKYKICIDNTDEQIDKRARPTRSNNKSNE